MSVARNEVEQLPEGLLQPVDPLDTRRYFIAVRRLADTLSHGTDRSRFLGSGLEYVQSRPYVPGDPVKSIDWRVTARTGEVHIKEYEAPKRMPAWILFDTSASMTYASIERSKYMVAAQIAGGIAFACLDRVSPVGLLGTGQRELRVNPSLSKDEVMQWLVKLRRFRVGERTLARRITELNARLRRPRVRPLRLPRVGRGRRAQADGSGARRRRAPVEGSRRGRRRGGRLHARGEPSRGGSSSPMAAASTWIEATGRALRRGGIDHLLISTAEPFAGTGARSKDRAVLAGGR